MSGKGVYYGANVTAAHALTGLQAVIVGGGNSAGQAAVHLARYCERVTIVVRGASLRETMSAYLVDAIEAAGIAVRTGVEVTGGEGEGRLERVTVRDRSTGAEEQLRADGLFVMIGARPRTEWLPDGLERDADGYLMTGADASGDGWSAQRRPHPVRDHRAGHLRRR